MGLPLLLCEKKCLRQVCTRVCCRRSTCYILPVATMCSLHTLPVLSSGSTANALQAVTRPMCYTTHYAKCKETDKQFLQCCFLHTSLLTCLSCCLTLLPRCPLLQVLVGSPAAPPPTVKVATYSATTPHPLPPPGAAAVPAAMSLSRLSSAAASGSLPQGVSSSSTQLRAAVAGSAVAAPGPPHAAAAVAAALMSKVVPDQCLLLASRPQDIAAELALQLEYTAGAN